MNKYKVEFTETLSYLSQDIETDSKEEAIEEAFVLMENDVIPIVNSNMNYSIYKVKEKENENTN